MSVTAMHPSALLTPQGWERTSAKGMEMSLPDPITAIVGVARESYGLIGGAIDRVVRANAARLDAEVLVRLLSLEARRNLGVLEVTSGREGDVDAASLWDVSTVLDLEVLETVLGQGAVAAKAFEALRQLPVYDPDVDRESTDFLTSLYVRTKALQALALLNHKVPLPWVRVDVRLRNIRHDTVTLVKALAQRLDR